MAQWKEHTLARVQRPVGKSEQNVLIIALVKSHGFFFTSVLHNLKMTILYISVGSLAAKWND